MARKKTAGPIDMPVDAGALPLLVQQALAAFDTGDYGRAARLAAEGMASVPSPGLAMIRIRSEQAVGDAAAALDTARAAVARFPQHERLAQLAVQLLERHGRFDEALAVQDRFAEANPSLISARLNLVMMMMRKGDVLGALDRYLASPDAVRFLSNPDNVPQLDEHALAIYLGGLLRDAGPAFDQAVGRLFAPDNRRGWPAAHQALNQLGRLFLQAGQGHEARRALAASLMPSPAQSAIFGPKRPAAGGALRTRIDAAFDAWEKQKQQFLPSVEEMGRLDDAIRRNSHRTFMLVMMGNIFASSRFIPNTMVGHFRGSLDAVGLKHVFVPADDVAQAEHNAHVPIRQIMEKKKSLFHLIRDKRPDAIVFDGNRPGTRRGLNRHFLRAAARAAGTKTINYVADAFDAGEARKSATWHADVTYINIPESPLLSDPRHRDSIVALTPPNDDALFHYQEAAKDIDVSFAGSLDVGFRAHWIGALQGEDVDVAVIGNNRVREGSPDFAGYAAVFRRSRIALNFGRRPDGVAMTLTGRVAEALHCGALLLEEEGYPMARWYVPYVHYVPFADTASLAEAVRFFLANEDYRLRITRAARELMQTKHSNRMIWGTLTERLWPA